MAKAYEKKRLPTAPPRGMRDHGPEEAMQREYIRKVLAKCFAKYGFLPLETSAMEQAEVLRGQYGEEGEKLIFHVLNSGDYLKKVRENAPELLSEGSPSELRARISERALRYDLTVPLARYAASHYQELGLPFRRYQMQPVWRADRPQKGRFREFYQCDADIVGSDSILSEVDMILLIDEAFNALGLPDYELHLNHRGLFSEIAKRIGAPPDKEQTLIVAMDKLYKQGKAAVEEELRSKGFSEGSIKELWELLAQKPINQESVKGWGPIEATSNGIKELWALGWLWTLWPDSGKSAQIDNQEVLSTKSSAVTQIAGIMRCLDHVRPGRFENRIIELRLARGLSYYTGTIFEVSYPGYSGSLLGGGRYDNLTARFSATALPGVGISFGLDRIHELMLEKKLFSAKALTSTQLLVTYERDPSLEGGTSWKKEVLHFLEIPLRIVESLRSKHIRCEHYHKAEKLSKQLSYAEKRNIRYILFLGRKECTELIEYYTHNRPKIKEAIENIKFSLRDRHTGEQHQMTLKEIVSHIKGNEEKKDATSDENEENATSGS